MSMIRPTQKQWNDFVRKHVQTDGESNVNANFAALSRGMAVAYFEYLRAAWISTKEHFTEEEFCQINGNVPQKFFEKNIRDSEVTKEMESLIILM